ncbi:MAG: threonine ammonia-lyase, partial [Peptococcaceae bacterium]|nr:threonine ammonia-lyase [Peptococcaceae bacterium]
GNRFYFTLETAHTPGSFKTRGAYNKIPSRAGEDGARGVTAASAGNHGQGVAYAATRAGISCVIVMPEGAPISKVAAAEGYGARVVLAGGGYDDAYRAAREMQRESGAAFIHGFDDVEVIAGQGTIALELLAELPQMDAVVVPVGGGGLIAGIAFALKNLKPGLRVIGVQARGAPAMEASLRSGRLCGLANTFTFADGIAVRRPGGLPFSLIRRYVDEIVLVDDEEIAGAILLLLERTKIVVEGAGAAGLAALLQRKTSLRGATVAVLLSGGNIDMNVLSIIIERGLAKTGRYVRLRTVITDRPGSLSTLLAAVAGTGANVISISHDRIKPTIPLKQAEIELALETRGQQHVSQILTVLRGAGYQVGVFPPGAGP